MKKNFKFFVKKSGMNIKRKEAVSSGRVEFSKKIYNLTVFVQATSEIIKELFDSIAPKREIIFFRNNMFIHLL